MSDSLSPDLIAKREKLFAWLRSRSCVLAFSGGVDSSTLAKALVEARSGLNDRKPIGYYAVSATSSELERKEAFRIADEIGIELRVIESDEFNDARFVENSPMRCYWCKKIRFGAIKRLASESEGTPVDVLDGSNADDKGDYRPGAKAAREIGVLSPFAELGIAKKEIRALAADWNLSVADKPSNPCLATRFAYGLKLSIPLLRQVDSAEIAIKEISNVPTCRARVDLPGCVRIEVPEEYIEKTASAETRKTLVDALRKIGFKFVSLDLEGFYTGKNNRALES